MNNIHEMRKKRGEIWDRAKAFLTEHQDENGMLSAEDTSQYERMEQEVVDLGHAIEREERAAQLEREMNAPTASPLASRPEARPNQRTGRGSDEYRSAFWTAMRNRGGHFSVQNALQIGTDSEGGYLVPDEYERTLVDALQEENRLQTEYQQLYASAQIPFAGKTLTVAQLAPYKQDLDRAVRKSAFEAEGRFFDENREKFDEIYDRLVKNRTEQARRMGYENFIPLGYIRMKRNGYGISEVEAYRKKIVEEMVPAVSELKKVQQKRIGADSMQYFDDTFLFPDGNPVPFGSADEILTAGRQMYRALSPETAEFIDFMFRNELFDVLAKEGKAPGGYCTYIPSQKSPFIFSNFNGTAGDVDVLTHEAGHAFAAYQAAKQNLLPEYADNTLEACEVHSMSMEFLTSDYHHLFFADQTDKYQLFHAESAVFFLPYGCMVDEFQHIVYGNPEMTPQQRNEAWMILEQKYRPYLTFGDLPFYGRGAGWQRQMHIYLNPFYYIDYCLAQTVALQFWALYLKDPQDAWKRYLALVNQAGTGTFVDVVKAAGLKSPFEDGCVKEAAEVSKEWCLAHQLKK